MCYFGVSNNTRMKRFKPAHLVTAGALLAFVYMAWYLGFFSSYNYITAMMDQNKGKIMIIVYGTNPPPDPARDSLAAAFGFRFVKTGLIPSKGEKNGISIYNKTMMSYLKQTHGHAWWQQVKHQFRDLKKEE